MPLPEKTIISRIRRLARSKNSEIFQGIGDDCAILRPRAGQELVITTDLSIEGTHFRRDWQPADSVGHRCLARGLSDVAAMGADPIAAFLSLGLPPGLPQKWVNGFLRGLLKLANRFNVSLAGGDIAESKSGIVADIIVVGSVPRGKAIRRSTARPGDIIYVTGALGGSAATLQNLYQASKKQRPRADNDEYAAVEKTTIIPKIAKDIKSTAAKPVGFALRGHDFSRAASRHTHEPALAAEGQIWPSHIIRPVPHSERDIVARRVGTRHFYPEPRLAIGKFLREHNLATAMIDLSDGLSTDLAHICEESSRRTGIGATLNQNLIPIARGANLEFALHGGEDYELLFTTRKSISVPVEIAGVPVTEIGWITREKKILITDCERSPKRLVAKGWEHFSKS